MTREEVIDIIRKNIPHLGIGAAEMTDALNELVPELRESEDERIWKAIDEIMKLDKAWEIAGKHGLTAADIRRWVKKQKEPKPADYPYLPGWRKNRDDNKPELKRSVLMLTTHGVAEGEWLGEKWCQYRWSCGLKDDEVLYWMHLSDLVRLEKEDEQKEQKEQNPADDKAFEKWVDDWYQGSKEAGGDVVMSEAEFKNWSRGIRNMYANQESAEWSKMDKENIDSLVIILHKALSKGISCKEEVLDLTDWLQSLRPSWKPSEQEKGALRTAICILTEVRKFPKAAEQLQNILDAFEGKKSHKDWKPSEEQMEALNYAIAEWDGGKKLEGLYALRTDLKKL